jgi:hypothetical protein
VKRASSSMCSRNHSKSKFRLYRNRRTNVAALFFDNKLNG